jgi:2-methylthioadenine synthetase
MHRAYTAEKYLDLVERIRRARNGVAITTDIIVGFPGETDDDYRQTRDLAEEIQFDNAFVFRYSPRRDTPPRKCRIKSTNTSKNSAIKICSIVNKSNRRILERLVGARWKCFAKAPAKQTAPA